MALTITIFAVMLIISLFVGYLGARSYTIFGGILLLSLCGVLIMSTGMILFSDGLQLDNTAYTTQIGDKTIVTYQYLTTDTDVGLNAIANVLLYSGIIPIIAAIALNILYFTRAYKSKKDEWRI